MTVCRIACWCIWQKSGRHMRRSTRNISEVDAWFNQGSQSYIVREETKNKMQMKMVKSLRKKSKDQNTRDVEKEK